MRTGEGDSVCRRGRECVQEREKVCAGDGESVCRRWRECVQEREKVCAGEGERRVGSIGKVGWGGISGIWPLRWICERIFLL